MNKKLHTYKHNTYLSRSMLVSDIARELELRDNDEIPQEVHDLLAEQPFYRAEDSTLGRIYQALFPSKELVQKSEGWYQIDTLELNEGHYFEALDRSHVLMSAYSDFVESHPAVQAHARIRQQADKALTAMMAVYQAIGAKMPWDK